MTTDRAVSVPPSELQPLGGTQRCAAPCSAPATCVDPNEPNGHLVRPDGDHDLGPLGGQHRNRRDVKKGASGQGLVLPGHIQPAQRTRAAPVISCAGDPLQPGWARSRHTASFHAPVPADGASRCSKPWAEPQWPASPTALYGAAPVLGRLLRAEVPDVIGYLAAVRSRATTISRGPGLEACTDSGEGLAVLP
jgi:hypothetical protein